MDVVRLNAKHGGAAFYTEKSYTQRKDGFPLLWELYIIIANNVILLAWFIARINDV